MKYFITMTLMLATLAVWGQAAKRTTAADIIRANDSIRLAANTIAEFDRDTSLSSASHTSVPTTLSVREFVFNWMQNVDTFYLDGTDLYLLTTKDTFIVDLSSLGGGGGSGVVNFYITNDSICLESTDSTFCIDIIDYLQEEVTDLYISNDTLYLEVGSTTFELPLDAYKNNGVLDVYKTGDTLFVVTQDSTYAVPFSSVVANGVLDVYKSGDTIYVVTQDSTFELPLAGYIDNGVLDIYESGDTIYIVTQDSTYEVPLAGITGSGTLNYIPKWTPSGTQLGNSQLFDDGIRVGIGVASGLASRLTVRGSTSGSNAIAIFEKQNGDKAFEIAEDSKIHFGKASARPYISAMDGGVSSVDGRELGIWAGSSTFGVNKNIIAIRNSAQLQFTSGSSNLVWLYSSFAPSTGDGVYSSLRIAPLIDQSGSASGVTNGIIVSPNLTNAVNWRSIVTTNTEGLGFYESGGAKSRFTGRVQIGADSDPDRVLEVTGDVRITQSVDSADVEYIWCANEEGDLKKMYIGDGIEINGDTISASGGSSPTPARWYGYTADSGFGTWYDIPAHPDFDTMDLTGLTPTLDTVNISFSPSTAKWTFDIAGTYIFSYTLTAQLTGAAANKKFYVALIKNSTAEVFPNSSRVHGAEVLDFVDYTAFWMVTLDAGDYLQLTMSQNAVSPDTTMSFQTTQFAIYKIAD